MYGPREASFTLGALYIEPAIDVGTGALQLTTFSLF